MAPQNSNNSPPPNQTPIQVRSVRKHMAAFQQIAEENRNNRATMTAGYVASVDYVEAELLAIGYEVERQVLTGTFGQTTVTQDGETYEEFPLRTVNLLAKWPADTQSRYVLLGAHLDSKGIKGIVSPEEADKVPGINDNASGVSLLLDIARKRVASGETEGIRFAFWDTEEAGLVGSRLFVEDLTPTELSEIQAYLNFDMVASPNGMPFVYGDEELRQIFQESADMPLALIPYVDWEGGSDDYFFHKAGIPVAGLYTGESLKMTQGQAEQYGGNAGQAYDPCYHRFCDTYENTDTPQANENLKLILTVVQNALDKLSAASSP